MGTVTDGVYLLSFAFSPRPNTPIADNWLEVKWDGVVVDDTIQAAGNGDTSWTTYSYLVQASGTTTELRFTDLGAQQVSGGSGTFLDDVSVIGPIVIASLTPSEAANPVGTEHTVTATVKIGDDPMQDIDVGFEVSGDNTESQAPLPTNASGQVTLSYSGSSVGEDTIMAYIDVDGSDSYNAGEPYLEATKYWVILDDLEPGIAYNLVGTEHCVMATISPAVPGVDVSFMVTGANPTSGPPDPIRTTNGAGGGGEATYCYNGTNTGVDTIRAYLDTNGDGSYDVGEPTTDPVTKLWFLNFVTGGGNIKVEATNPKGKPIEQVAWTFGGNVGYFEDGTIHGQFQIADHTGKGTVSWHCHNDFESLIFWGGPTDSPPASLDTAQFVGTFTSNKGGEEYLRVTIWDDQEPGRDYDCITVEVSLDGGVTWETTPWFLGNPISGGNLQVHEGYKS